MKRIICTLLFALSLLHCLAQTRKIDSLKRLLYHSSSAANRLKCLLALCGERESLPEDTLWLYALKAKALATQLKDNRARTLAILAQANAYIRWNNPDSAKALIQPEFARYKPADPATRSIYFELAGTRIDLMRNDAYTDLLSEVYQVLREAEVYRDSVVIAESMNTIGAIKYDLDLLPQSINWFYKALSFTTEAPKFDNANGSIYLNLANSYWWIGKQDSAMYYVNKADRYNARVQNLYLLSVGAQKRATIYLKLGQYHKAEQEIQSSLNLIKPICGEAPQQDKLIVLASVYEHQKLYDKAIAVLNNGLVKDSLYRRQLLHGPNKENSSGDFQMLFYHQELASLYKLKGDRQSYEATLEKIIAEKDTVYQASSASAIAELETRYQFQKKEAVITRQKLELTRQKLELTKENYLLYGSIIVLLLGAVIFWLIFKAYRRRQSMLASLAVNAAGESERKRISADLHDNLGAQLSFIKRNVEFMLDKPKDFNAADESRYLDYINDFATNAMIDLRETIWVLNKEEVFMTDLADKLNFYLGKQLHGARHIKWDLHDHIVANWKLSSSEVMHLFRIVQELVSNSLRHAQATRIIIELKSPEEQHYRLEINDNGCGFDMKVQQPGHYGLNNIRQRALELMADLEIISVPGQGTRIILEK